MKSMTGFGQATYQSPEFFLHVTVKSLNGRFLDIKFHGPKLYHALEAKMRKQISSHIQRGTLDISITRRLFNGSEQVFFNRKRAKKWFEGFSAMARELKLKTPESAEVLLSVPELTHLEERVVVSPKEQRALFKILGEALLTCVQAREAEGRLLKKDIQAHLKGIGQQKGKAQKMGGKISQQSFEKYQKKLEDHDLTQKLDQQGWSRAILMYVDKTDISEEVDRLEAHIKAIGRLMDQGGPIGKKLDFYGQELLREANTLGSKAASFELTQVVIHTKSLIEKYREQVQNVE